MAIESLNFELRFLSPGFVGGADGNKIPEQARLEGLRIPSLRGALRFWFRAKEQCTDTEELYRKESRVFGSADHGQGVRLIPVSRPRITETPFQGSGQAQRYLGYGAASESDKHAIPAGTTYGFQALGNSHQMKELRRCLLLLHLFGGVGARSRRSWGAVEVLGGSIVPDTEPRQSPESWIETALGTVWPAGQPNRPSVRADQPSWTAFGSDTQLALLGPFHGWKQGMGQFFEKMKDIKDETSAPGGDQPPPPRVRLGLPWRHGADGNEVSYQARKTGGDVDRRASPLLFSFTRIGSELHGTMLWLSGSFFGESSTQLLNATADSTPSLPSDAALRDLVFSGQSRIVLP